MKTTAYSISDVSNLHDAVQHSQEIIPLSSERTIRAKKSFTTRRVPLSQLTSLLTGEVKPRAGDLVLARVTRIRQHKRIELATGRRAHLHIGDEIVVSYGHRYAPDQFEAEVPSDLGLCHLVAAGGIAALYRSRNQRIKPPTEIKPIGILSDSQGRRVNLADFQVDAPETRSCFPPAIAVFGTAMNAGKTTMAGHLIRGLTSAGLRVGSAKITGTGSGLDIWYALDAGAEYALDFTDAGYASTVGLSSDELNGIARCLINHLGESSLDTIVVEVADGIFQDETSALLNSPVFAELINGVLFATPDACGALVGTQHLQKAGLHVFGVGGLVTASPLAMREAEQLLEVPVYSLADLQNPDIVELFASADKLSVIV